MKLYGDQSAVGPHSKVKTEEVKSSNLNCHTRKVQTQEGVYEIPTLWGNYKGLKNVA